MTKLLKIVVLALCGLCAVLALWFALGLFDPKQAYAAICLRYFFLNVVGALCFYGLYRFLRSREGNSD